MKRGEMWLLLHPDAGNPTDERWLLSKVFEHFLIVYVFPF